MVPEGQVSSGGFGANDSPFLLRSAVQESGFRGTVGDFRRAPPPDCLKSRF